MEITRLDKFLSTQLNISRKDAKKLLKTDNIILNGATVRNADTQFDADTASVTVNGRPICFRKHLYIMMNKPEGIVSSTDDSDTTVIDILPEELKRAGLFPAGRLDKDTTGFVLITDDGEFAHNILSPSRHIKKTYIVTLERTVTDSETELIEKGMDLGDILLKPAKLSHISKTDYEIVITEGRYHQIKRMFAKTGNKVTALKRIQMGNLPLDKSLKPGECRELTQKEIEQLTEKTV